MSFRDLNRRHVHLIGRYSIRHAIRGGAGIVFLFLAMFFGLTVAHVIISPVESWIEQQKEASLVQTPKESVRKLVDFARVAVEWAISSPASNDAARAEATRKASAWADFLLDERPALLSAVFLILLLGMPFVIPFGAYNQTAGEIGNRGFRYLLLRTERANIFVGRFVGTALFAILVQALVIITIAFYLAMKVKLYAPGDVALWSVHGFLALLFLSLPYVALCAWVSSACDSSMLCLVIVKLIIAGVLLVAYLGRKVWEPIYYVKWLLPWGVQNELLAPHGSRVALAAGACLLYMLAFLYLGFRHFEKRDL